MQQVEEGALRTTTRLQQRGQSSGGGGRGHRSAGGDAEEGDDGLVREGGRAVGKEAAGEAGQEEG